MHCQNEDHDDGVDAVAIIRLIELDDDPAAEGYAVCPPHLIDYVQGIYLNNNNGLRLAFRVEPTS